jgi:hypothetical protein
MRTHVITDIRIQLANLESKLLSSRVVRTSKLEVVVPTTSCSVDEHVMLRNYLLKNP